jgi:hypothetical protein
MTDRGASRTIQCPAAAISLAATAVLLAATACTPAPPAPVSLSWRFVDGRGCDLAGIVDVVARGAAPEPSPPLRLRCRDGAAPDRSVEVDVTDRPATLTLDAETITGAVLYSGRVEVEDGDPADRIVTLRHVGGRAE